MIWSMYNIQNDFKKRVKLIISGSFFSWNNIIRVPFVLFEVDFLHNKRSLSDARSKSFSFASVATATQIILATLPLYSQNANWRSSSISFA
jgi:hypothetical protein